MKAKLVCSDAVDGGEYVLERLPITIGRSAQSDIQITDSWASRFHCEIGESDGALLVRDLGSSNGTLVNGDQVSNAPLMPGDTLTVGISTFAVRSLEFGADSQFCEAGIQAGSV